MHNNFYSGDLVSITVLLSEFQVFITYIVFFNKVLSAWGDIFFLSPSPH